MSGLANATFRLHEMWSFLTLREYISIIMSSVFHEVG